MGRPKVEPRNIRGSGTTPDYSEAGLAARIQAILGSAYIDQLHPEGIVTTGGNTRVITGWKSYAKGTAAPTTENSFTAGTLLNRAATSSSANDAKSLQLNTSVTVKDIFVVSSAFVNTGIAYETLVNSGDSATAYMDRDGSTSNWYLTTGWTFQTDGYSTNAIPTTGTHVYRASNASNVKTGVTLCGWKDGARAWQGNVGSVVLCSSVVSVSQAAQIVAQLQNYYLGIS